jgi:hypothetical protein
VEVGLRPIMLGRSACVHKSCATTVVGLALGGLVLISSWWVVVITTTHVHGQAELPSLADL